MRWLLLVYRIPRQPSASRVFVWRKLKQLGAVAMQDAIWVLPNTPRTLEQFQWLAAEITELKGEALLWQADQVYATNEQSLIEKFEEPVIAEYEAILAALKKKGRDLAALSKQFQEAQAKDYFASELGKKARAKLLEAGQGGT
jgi:hypothetical protein